MVTWQESLGSSPQVCGGGICAAGTRIPVTLILDSLAEGAAKDEVLVSYPSLRVHYIDAAPAYAAELAGGAEYIPSPVSPFFTSCRRAKNAPEETGLSLPGFPPCGGSFTALFP